MRSNWRKSRAAGDHLHIEHPLHKAIYRDLLKYLPLMKSVMASDVSGQMKLAYATAMHDPYRKELHEYFYQIKHAIKKNKESRASLSFTLATNASPTTAVAAASGSRDSIRTSSPLTSHGTDDDDDDYSDDTMTHMSSSALELVTELRVDHAFARCLSDVCEIVFDEQQFCAKFFHLDIHYGHSPSQTQASVQDGGSTAAKVSAATPAQNAQDKLRSSIRLGMESELQKMLDRMFKSLSSNFKTQINWIDRRTDKFFVINMLVVTEQKFNAYQSKSSFLHILLAEVLAAVKSIFNHFIEKQLESIAEFRCVIKKTPVVSFVSRFLYFIDRFESILMHPTERRHIETAYLKLIKRMFEHLDALAETDEKHRDAFRLRNYIFFYRALSNRRFKSAEIGKYVATAQKLYTQCMHSYVTWIVRCKFGDLFEFFDGVETCLKTTDPEEISFQSAFSRSKLRDLIKKRSATFQRDVTDMMKRMEKHVNVQIEMLQEGKKSASTGSHTNLYGEVWDYLQEVFLERYRTMEQLVLKCYTNTALAPSSVQAADMFTAISNANATKLYGTQDKSGG